MDGCSGPPPTAAAARSLTNVLFLPRREAEERAERERIEREKQLLDEKDRHDKDNNKKPKKGKREETAKRSISGMVWCCSEITAEESQSLV